MDTKTILDAAKQLKNQIISHRRKLHQNPEVGSHLPQTTAYVLQQLKALGYEPQEICDSGIVATITGKETGKCILLRADMDALPIFENTQLDFRSVNQAMHACGHDMHTAMLLGAAALLQQHRQDLDGTVKLVFQPNEEGFTGAKDMISAGVLESPTPQAGLAVHVHSGTPSNLVLCGSGTFMSGCSVFRITVSGTSCHGSMPETGVDPINIAAHIYLGLHALISREISPTTPAVITVGKILSGDAPNVIPGEAVLEGTIRTFDSQVAHTTLRRIGEMAQNIASAFRGRATVEKLSGVPSLLNDPKLMTQMKGYVQELFGESSVVSLNEGGMGSEDFAVYSREIPCAYLLLGAGSKDENSLFGKPMHNEQVIFNEDILVSGAAMEAFCAIQWLKGSRKD